VNFYIVLMVKVHVAENYPRDHFIPGCVETDTIAVLKLKKRIPSQYLCFAHPRHNKYTLT